MRQWTLDRRSGRLACAERTETLSPRAAGVLALLVARRGEIVSREEMLADVWHGVTVNADIVRQYIVDIRSVLGDDPRAPTYIETVPRRGFRLVGEVQLAPESLSILDARPAIAVLRPDVFGAEADWRAMADALAEEIITDLARFPELAVVARHSAFAVGGDLREAAAALGARYLLASSVAPLGDALRCHFQLIDGLSGHHLWVERHEIPRTAMPSMPDEVAAKVANAVGARRGEIHAVEGRRVRRRAAKSLSAYEHYLLACHHEHIFDRENTAKGLAHAERAVALDPDFARSWVLLWLLLERDAVLGAGQSSDAVEARRHAASQRAAEADPHDPMVLATVAFEEAKRGNVADAVAMVRRAALFGRNQADASALIANAFSTLVGDMDEARRFCDIAMRLNPSPPSWYAFVRARVAFFSGRYEECVAATRTAPPHHMPAAIYATLATAMLDDRVATVRAAAAFHAQFRGFNFTRYAAQYPIAAPPALALFNSAVERLSAAARLNGAG